MTDHANKTNPCVGICVSNDEGVCIGCFRTNEERMDWYQETDTWREDVLKELANREKKIFG